MLSQIRTFLRRLAIGLLFLITVLVLAGASYQAYATHRDNRTLPPPGQMVDIGDHLLHIDCRGEGSPMILLESGAQLWSSGWRHIHQDLARDHRVCAYDRSGLGWSDPGPPPFDAETAVTELHALLERSGESLPFVFVGHSLGGMLAQVYNDRYPGEIAAAVYIDSGDPAILIEDFEAQRDDPIRPCSLSCKAQIGFAYLGVPRLVLNNVDLLDDPAYPPDAVAEFKALAARPEFLRSAFWIVRYMPAAAFQTLDAGPILDRPVLVLYSGNYGELVSAGEDPAEMQRWKNAYVDSWQQAADLSPGGVGPVRIPDANHITVIASRDHALAVSDHIRDFMGRVP
ncbi:MAG: alpha/beta fold hydrolase [Gammaproteobacteria bacterium]